MISLAVALLFLGALLVFLLTARSLARLHRDRRRGAFVSVDVRGAGPVLEDAGLGLRGRPDELRRRRDGRIVPVELKSRRAPPRGPSASHVLQVQAYCLLLERAGAPPPYGILRYGDGSEWEIPWTPMARDRVLATLAATRRRYGGEATPAWGKCRACPWRPGCDARAG